jgi:hypothetical protein
MSRLMIQTFFPVNLEKAQSYWLGNFLLNEVLFPPHVAELCPEVVVTIFGRSVRQPVLAASATLGMIVEVDGRFKNNCSDGRNYKTSSSTKTTSVD